MKKIFWALGVVLLLILLWGAFALGPFLVSMVVNTLPVGPPVRTVDGPESPHLLLGTDGYLLEGLPRGGIKAILLPELKEIMVRQPIPDEDHANYEPIHSVSGPDRDGRIAYVSYNPDVLELDQARHFLKVTSIDGRHRETIFSRPGDALWDDVIGSNLALSPVGGYVAFVGPLKDTRVLPEDVWQTGPLEIWDVVRKTRIGTDKVALDENLSWFPDGKKLAYTKLVVPAELAALELDLGEYVQQPESWFLIPAVYVYDVSTEDEVFLHIGWRVTLSTDGSSAILYEPKRGYRLIDVETRTSRPISWPGRSGDVIGFTGPQTICYWGQPTTGAPQAWAKVGSPLVPRKRMQTIKLADLRTGDFQTVIESIDPRDVTSFGPGPEEDPEVLRVRVEQAARLRDESAVAQFKLGRFSRKEGELERARQYLKRAVELDPKMAKAWFELSLVAEKLDGDWDKVLQYARAAIESDPEFAFGYHQAGRALTVLGRPAEATENYRRFMKLKPESEEANWLKENIPELR